MEFIRRAGPCGRSRKLVTGSKYDVQFDKLDGTYDFGFAAFDNAQGALHLKFAK